MYTTDTNTQPQLLHAGTCTVTGVNNGFKVAIVMLGACVVILGVVFPGRVT